MISDERLEQFAHDKRMCNVTDEIVSMAKELQAYRQAFSEPFGYVHRLYETMETGVISKDHEAYKGTASHLPLYRKPTIPDLEI